MASVSESITFREFCPLYYLLNAIPTKIQKGFRSIVVYLTALDANGDYIAVGSSIGMLYLYCRHLNQMKKYNFELRRFDVTGIHKNSITALAWSPNGMKLFSGDDKGKIVYSSLDLDQGVCHSRLMLEEPASIVQLDYSQKVLLVSTAQRSLLFHTEEKSVRQIGAQPRKRLWLEKDVSHVCLLEVVRHATVSLWVAHGGTAVSQGTGLCPQVEPGSRAGIAASTVVAVGLAIAAAGFAGGYALQAVKHTEPQATIAGLEGSGDIVSVSCTENEIFFLKGDRNIIRISSRPEGLASIDSAKRLTFTISSSPPNSPVREGPMPEIRKLRIGVVRDKPQVTIQISAPAAVSPASSVRDGLETSGCPEQVHGQRAEKPPGATPSETRLRGSSVASSVASEPRSRSSSLNSTDSGSGPQAAPELGKSSQLTSKRFSVISSEDFDQELIVKPLKVKKKKRKKKTEGGSGTTCPSSLESTPCWECPGDSPQSLNTDLLSTTSSLGSIVDQSSTGSPDQECSLSGEANSVLPEYSDPETFSVLEVPLPAPDSLKEEGDGRTEIPPCDGAGETQPPSGVLRSPWHPREDAEGGDDIAELEEEPCPVSGGPGSAQSPCREQGSSAEAREAGGMEPAEPQSTLPEAPLPGSPPVPSSLSWAPGAERWLPGTRAEEPSEEQGFLRHLGAPGHLGSSPRHAVTDDDTGQQAVAASECDLGSAGGRRPRWVSASVASAREQPSRDQALTSSDEEDIYAHGLPSSSSETSVTELAGSRSLQDLRPPGTDEPGLLKSEEFAESWMGYSGPGYGILSLAVSEKYIWCLDYKGGLFCSALPGAGLRWQKFEDAVQQVAVSPSGALLWKIEQKSNRAFACGKVTIKGKRHWYEALPQAVFVALSDDTAWIIRTNGDLYLQTGLSVDRPCARAVKVDCPYPLSQVAARNSVVWALTEQRVLLYREGVSSFCPEGELWKCDIVSERQALEPVCITLGDQQTLWALDIRGHLWFRTGIISKKPQGDDDHWWQVSITDYVVFDQCSLFQTIIHATHSVATAAQVPVEKVAGKLRMALWSQQLQCQPSLLGVSSSGVWISSGKNEIHVSRGSLIGTYWNNVVPRGTASATKWAFVLASTAPTKEGSSLWLCQSSKDLCRVSAQHAQSRPSTVQLPPDAEMRAYAACQDALWALDSLGQVFIRTLSASCPTGMHWTRLDLSQLGMPAPAARPCLPASSGGVPTRFPGPCVQLS
ncbi:hypothetical protein J1605_011851 [Eschrichtius robustus]|uniref:Tectonin beta-propeller repeat-containing protein 2 n=1 Tax=Eschrichtius robustus TaxID=9764 RepID=A0AB34GMD6_ESCRO|nr:hypothetical protein J1605_011851 [Eschrichtius robustus]